MALLEWTDGFDYALELDAAETYGHEHTAETTDRVIDAGATVTDHVRLNPDTMTLEGVVTNSPLRAMAPTRDRVVSTQSIKLPDGTGVSVAQWDATFDRVRQTDELFQQLMESRALLKITTALRVMENLILTRYAPKKDGSTGNSLAVVLEVKHLRFATTQRATVTPVVRRAIPPQQRGAQPVDRRALGLRIYEDGLQHVGRVLGGD